MFRILLDPHRGRQRPQRPLRDVVAPVARSAPLLLPRGQAQRLAVSFLDGEPASLHELDLAGLCGCRKPITAHTLRHYAGAGIVATATPRYCSPSVFPCRWSPRGLGTPARSSQRPSTATPYPEMNGPPRKSLKLLSRRKSLRIRMQESRDVY